MLHTKISEYMKTHFPDIEISDWKFNGFRYIMDIHNFKYKIISNPTVEIEKSNRFRFDGLNIPGFNNQDSIYIVESNINIIFSLIKELVEIDLHIINMSTEARKYLDMYNNGKYLEHYRNKKINNVLQN